MPFSGYQEFYGPGAQASADRYAAGVMGGGSGGNAYGTRPTLPAPVSTAPQNTATAISTGNAVNTQLPGYLSSLSSIGGNIASETSGQLPDDVIRQITQSAAERGVATGSPGSENSNAAMLRALGLTSLDLTQRGQSNLESILPKLPGAAISQNPAYFPTSGQASEVDQGNAIYRSAPDPAAASRAAMGAASAGIGAGRAAASNPFAGFSTGGGSSNEFSMAGQGGGGSQVYGPLGEGSSGFLGQDDLAALLDKYNPAGGDYGIQDPGTMPAEDDPYGLGDY